MQSTVSQITKSIIDLELAKARLEEEITGIRHSGAIGCQFQMGDGNTFADLLIEYDGYSEEAALRIFSSMGLVGFRALYKKCRPAVNGAAFHPEEQ